MMIIIDVLDGVVSGVGSDRDPPHAAAHVHDVHDVHDVHEICARKVISHQSTNDDVMTGHCSVITNRFCLVLGNQQC